MLIHLDRSALLLVDLQERLQPAIDEAAQVLEASLCLTRVAQRLDVPVTVSYTHLSAFVVRR